MTAILHTIRVDHFNLCFILRRLSALSETLDRSNHNILHEPIALAFRYLENLTDGGQNGGAQDLLSRAISEHGAGVRHNTNVLSLEPHIRGRLRCAVKAAMDAGLHSHRSVARLRSAVGRYVQFERAQIVHFETHVIPLALSAFDGEDWRRVDAALEHRQACEDAIARDELADALFCQAVESSRQAIDRAAALGPGSRQGQDAPRSGHCSQTTGRRPKRSRSLRPEPYFWRRLPGVVLGWQMQTGTGKPTSPLPPTR